MKKIFILLACIVTIGTNAQTLKGFVFSSDENAPAEFTNVILYSMPDTVFQTGVITYTDGIYTFNNVKSGRYYVKSTYVGYEENGAFVEISEGSEMVWADTIFLTKKENEIEGVEVTADMIRAEELVDRTVYQIPPDLAKASTSGFDVLRKIPSVQVDFNNNITLDGKSNFIIQVDGKQRDKEFLTRLTPEDIKLVEIIHNPSGKYDGSIDGVINIKLNPEARKGINGNVTAMIRPSDKPTGMAHAAIDFGLEKVTVYVSGFSFFQGLDNSTTNYTSFNPSVGVDSILNNKGIGDFNIVSSAINTGFDYYINDKNNLSFNYNYKPTTLSSELDNNADIFNGNNLNYLQSYSSITSTNSQETNASLFYKKEYKKPIQELTAEVTFYSFHSKDTNRFNSMLESLISDTSYNSSRNEEINNNRNYVSAKVDYVQPIGVLMRFETGYQAYYQTMEYNFGSSNNMLNNTFNYGELRNAAYAGLTFNDKKWGLQGTFRAERSDISINDSTTSGYFTFLPSANIQYKINGKHSLKFTYNRRINRPSIYNLNPFMKLNTNLSIETGNPFLEPEHRDKLQLTYSMKKGKVSLAPYLYYEYMSDKISNVNKVITSPFDEGLTTFSQPENLITGDEKGLGVNGTLWFVNLNGKIYQGKFNEYKGDGFRINEREYYSYSLTAQAFAPLFKKKVNAFAFFSWNGVRVEAQSKSESPIFYGMGAQKNGEKHTYGLFYLMPLSTIIEVNKTIVETAGFYSKTTNGFDVSWYIQLMYTYKFSNGKSVKKLNRKADVESDTKGGGIR